MVSFSLPLYAAYDCRKKTNLNSSTAQIFMVFGYPSLSLTIFHYLSLSFTTFRYPSLSFTIFGYLLPSLLPYLLLSVAIFLCPSLSFTIFGSFKLSFTIFRHPSLSLTIFGYRWLSSAIPATTLPLATRRYLSLSLTIFHYLSLSLAIFGYLLLYFVMLCCLSSKIDQYTLTSL